MTETDSRSRVMVVVLAILVEGGLAILALALGTYFQQMPLDTVRFDGTAILVGVVATIPMVAGALALLHWPVIPGRSIRDVTLKFLCPFLAPCTIPDLAAIALIAGVGEEMLFRGVGQPALARWGETWMGPAGAPWFGLAAASVLFGLLHAVTLSYAVLATGIGVYLGWLWVATGNLLTPIIVHALYDFALLYYLLAGPGRALWEKQAIEPESPDGAGPEPEKSHNE